MHPKQIGMHYAVYMIFGEKLRHKPTFSYPSFAISFIAPDLRFAAFFQ